MPKYICLCVHKGRTLMHKSVRAGLRLLSDGNKRNYNNASHLPSSCFCPVTRTKIISHKKVSDGSQHRLWVVHLHLLCISWAGLSLGASQSWLSVRAEDVSPVSSVPYGFPWLTLQLYLLATEQIKAQCVCICVCVHACLPIFERTNFS